MKNKTLPDIYMTLVSLTIIAFGILAIYSTEIMINPDIPSFKNHVALVIAMLIIGFIIIVSPDFFKFIDSKVPIILVITFILFVLLRIFGIGVEGSVARRWLYLPLGFTLQPSEVAKITAVVYFASVLSKKGEKLNNIKKGLFPPLIVLLLICVAIAFEPDLGTSMLFAAVGFTMFFYSGIPIRFLVLSGLLLLFIFILFVFNVPYMKNRIQTYLEPNSKESSVYQMSRAKAAFEQGSLLGLPDEEYNDTNIRLPAHKTDFIFAAIARKYGFVGDITLLLLYLVFIVRGFTISLRAYDLFQKYMAFGFTICIGIQAYLNILVATLIIPTTGIPLPFISYGRNAFIVNMIMLSIILKISRRSKKE